MINSTKKLNDQGALLTQGCESGHQQLPPASLVEPVEVIYNGANQLLGFFCLLEKGNCKEIECAPLSFAKAYFLQVKRGEIYIYNSKKNLHFYNFLSLFSTFYNAISLFFSIYNDLYFLHFYNFFSIFSTFYKLKNGQIYNLQQPHPPLSKAIGDKRIVL